MRNHREYTTRDEDRAAWPEGPWKTEPDKVQWIDEATGLDCLIVRGPLGAWCGYVGVAPGHPMHGVGYDDVDPYPAVHGGLTFSAACQEGAEETGVCHIPEPGRPDSVWWLGFDCGHLNDLIPGMILHHHDFMAKNPEFAHLDRDDVYRDRAYVQAEVEHLAQQLKGATDG